VPGLILRGVGFRGGAYSDQSGVLPLTGAATTELRGIHAPAFYEVFYPIRPWNTNYFDALANGGATRLAVTPAQFLTDPDSLTGVGTLRGFSSMDFRLYYSNNTQNYSGNVPALSEPLSITAISADVSGTMMNFSARVTGEPAAGVQEVWVTYTALDGPFAGTWQSLDLTRSATDSTLWPGALNLNGTLPEDVRFMVQAVNGVGLVTLMTNLGQYYSINLAPTEPTVLVLETPASTSGPYRTPASFSAVLTHNGTPLAGQRVIFSLGGQRRRAITGPDGRATVTMLLNGLPGNYDLRVSFLGTAVYQPSFAGPLTFTITKQGTTLTLTPPSATSHLGNGVLTVATLKDAAGNHLAEETVFFVVTGGSGSHSVAVITDFAGQAALENVNLPFDSYTVTAYFSGTIPLSTGETLVQEDARYTPSTAIGSLALINNAPSAGDDAYGVDEDDTLNVAAPGVLSNDNDPDGDMLTASLVSGPTHGVLTLNADGSFSYTPNHNFEDVDSFTYTASDGLGGTDTATVTITVDDSNEPPDCSTASPNPTFLWPPNNNFAPVSVTGVTDVDGDPVTITITGVRQDERVGRAKSSSPDARILGPNLVELRIERDGNGDGRVYHVYFTASDGNDSCSGRVRLGVVTHDQSSNLDAIDGGPLYDSTVPG
jgi:VCBS repeat-containing protein